MAFAYHGTNDSITSSATTYQWYSAATTSLLCGPSCMWSFRARQEKRVHSNLVWLTANTSPTTPISRAYRGCIASSMNSLAAWMLETEGICYEVTVEMIHTKNARQTIKHTAHQTNYYQHQSK